MQCLFLFALGMTGPGRSTSGDAERETDRAAEEDSEAITRASEGSVVVRRHAARHPRERRVRTRIRGRAHVRLEPTPLRETRRRGPSWQRPRRVVPSDDDDGTSMG